MTSERKERYEEFVAVSAEKAKQSLREGNKGFGAVLVKRMVKRLNPRLKFTRDYSRLRPDSLSCEEIIELQR